jgi:acetyl-CoA acyltransferase
MGYTAEEVAKQYNITREEQDQFAFESHMKALKANQEGKFANQIVPIPVEYNFLMKIRKFRLKI